MARSALKLLAQSDAGIDAVTRIWPQTQEIDTEILQQVAHDSCMPGILIANRRISRRSGKTNPCRCQRISTTAPLADFPTKCAKNWEQHGPKRSVRQAGYQV